MFIIRLMYKNLKNRDLRWGVKKFIEKNGTIILSIKRIILFSFLGSIYIYYEVSFAEEQVKNGLNIFGGIIIFIWGCVGGFDWAIDSYNCFFGKIDYLFMDKVFIWEPNYNSYNEWVESMLLQDPTYDINIDLTRQNYVDGKYPNWDEIEDINIVNYILAELYGYEEDY